MPPRRMSEIGDESKQRLIDAAEELFLEKGYENTTVVEIGKRAGISHGSIPWHFGNKSGLLYAVVTRLFDQGSSTEPLETGQAGFNRLWREQSFYDHSPKSSLFGAFFLAELEQSPTHFKEVIERHIHRRDLFIDWINRSAIADSLTLKASPEAITEFWIGSARGIGLQKASLMDNFDLHAARHGLGVAIESLLGSDYYQRLDMSL